MRNSFFTILILALIIAISGVLSIYSSTYQKEGAWQDIHLRQILWVTIGLVCFFIVSGLNYRKLWDANYFIYGAALFFLFLVFVLGITRLGAQRWLKIAWFNFQPSEFAKLAIIIFLARYFSRKSVDDTSLLSGKFGIFRGLILPFIFVGIPMFLIIEQPDLGSGLMLLFVFVCLLYLTNVRLKYILTFLTLIILPLPFFWHFLRDYQKQRLLVFLNPNIDPLGAGYTIIQSRIAIGSGGFFGRGWLSGSQSQLYFLPESHTDFIFATFSEQWGFLGSSLLILLYYLIIRQGFVIAQRTQDTFGRLLAYGISLLLSMQVFINIAMNMGLAPVVGLPLPLMSYGGSSILVTFIALGILVNIDRTRTVF
ncbi:MAG: rod shape-determining protein RodA [Candidatus Omnitrophica bacterium]|jgi:rod shape determining protein RodA|nr:rod shape-determining protein RodA [Candidatus Omnitrophota bacterium]MDD5660955.1 rod shape-determining protein RodA [Candidatus Omnitrophota bacterium]